MNIAIMGMGKFFYNYKDLIPNIHIKYYIDNDKCKNHTVFEGKEVLLPNECNFDEIDFVIVMIYKDEEAKEQLRSLGLSDEKIKSYREIAQIFNMHPMVCAGTEFIEGTKWFEEGKRHVLIISHDFTRTGVPVAAMNMAKLFDENNYNPLVGALRNGTLTYDLQEENIPYIENLSITLNSTIFEEFIDRFDFILICTIAAAEYGDYIKKYKGPVLWWINEKHDGMFERYKLPCHRDNYSYFADGIDTINKFEEFYPEYRCRLLYYYLPDTHYKQIASEYKLGKEKKEIHIATIGTICKRKGQDIMLEAIRMLPNNLEEKITFDIIGVHDNESQEIEDNLVGEKTVCMWGEVSQEKLIEIYEQTDILICPSRDDTVPIVVTQAMQHGIPCLVTQVIGQAEMIRQYGGGIVVEANNSEQIVDGILQLISNETEFVNMKKQAREIYERYFSKTAVWNSIKNYIK